MILTPPRHPGRGPVANRPRTGLFDYPAALVAGDAAVEAYYRVEAGRVTSSGGLASQFDDQSPHGDHATQLIGGRKPTLDTATYAPLWCLSSFGGQVMEIGAGPASRLPAEGYTRWVVMALATTAGNQGIAAVGTLGGYSSTVESGKLCNREQGRQFVSDGNATTNRALVTWQRISGVDHCTVNGIEVAVTGNGLTNATLSGASCLFALLADLTFPSQVDLFEVMWMSRLLSGGVPGVGNPVTGEMALLKSYFSARYP